MYGIQKRIQENSQRLGSLRVTRWVGRPAGGLSPVAEVGALYGLVLRPITYLFLGSMPIKHFSLYQDLPTYCPLKEFPFPKAKSHSDSVKGVTQFLLETGRKKALVVPFNQNFMFLKYKVSHFYLMVCIIAPEF